MARLRIATFNVENLFARYRFNRNVNAIGAVRDGWKADQRYFEIFDRDSKIITARATKETRADVLCLQEVENLDTLKRFRTFFYGRKSYPYVALVDGNDPRQIDVAVLSKRPITRIRTHQHLWVAAWKYFLFSRDCLEVDIAVSAQKSVTLFVNHFKSMMGGRDQTRAKRSRQASGVKKVVTDRFGKRAGRHPFIVVGDLNDYRETVGGVRSGIRSLVDWNQVEDVVGRLPAQDRWTHYWSRQREYRQLDYILVSRVLARNSAGKPQIIRKGLPKRADRYKGPRFPRVGAESPKASDHCPVVFSVTI